jgi:hypothetical protein
VADGLVEGTAEREGGTVAAACADVLDGKLRIRQQVVELDWLTKKS